MAKPRLVAESGPVSGLELLLTEREEWIVGRDPDEATLIVEDPHASRQHLLIRRTPEGFSVENLSDTNPALLNGVPLETTHLLSEGDQLQVGDTAFRYTDEDEAISPKDSFGEDEEEESIYETIFEAPETHVAGPEIHLEPQERWLLKVVSGPNTGAEVRLGRGRAYLLGTDTASCDIVFHDLSVSRQHARLSVGEDEAITIEDLGSRNGVVFEGHPISEPHALEGNAVVSLGTTSLLLVDREAAQETVVAPAILPESAEPIAPEGKTSFGEPQIEFSESKKPALLSRSSLVVLIIAAAIATLVVIGGISLFTGTSVAVTPPDYTHKIEAAVASFSDVRYSYNDSNGRLFILGHVLTPVDKSELLYNLDNLSFIQSIDDNVVIDQNIWEEMNAILSKNPEWSGINMHAPRPGRFVLSGYLKTTKQAVSLQDYVHLNFPYLDRLENQVIVEDLLLTDVQAQLRSAGFLGVEPSFINGELTLTGYVSREELPQFHALMERLGQLTGVRNVKNLTVIIAEDRSMVDLTREYPIQGFSRHDGVTANVLINGQIVSRGDLFRGMKVVSITSYAVILEKDGIKYKIDYNQHGLWQGSGTTGG